MKQEEKPGQEIVQALCKVGTVGNKKAKVVDTARKSVAEFGH